jgi:hypothetical protein
LAAGDPLEQTVFVITIPSIVKNAEAIENLNRFPFLNLVEDVIRNSQQLSSVACAVREEVNLLVAASTSI